MRARPAPGQYRTCYLCAETHMQTIVVTGSAGILTMCETCAAELDRMLPQIRKKMRKERRKAANTVTLNPHNQR